MGNRSGFLGWLRASCAAAETMWRSDSESVLFEEARAVRPSTTARTEMCERLLGDVLMDGVVGEPGQSVSAEVNFDFGLVGFAELEDFFAERFEVEAQIGARDSRRFGATTR